MKRKKRKTTKIDDVELARAYLIINPYRSEYVKDSALGAIYHQLDRIAGIRLRGIAPKKRLFGGRVLSIVGRRNRVLRLVRVLKDFSPDNLMAAMSRARLEERIQRWQEVEVD